MRQLNRGLVFTNENCVGCNHCISGCPVLGANVSVVINKENKVLVDGNKCIHCGHCMDICTHGARDYRDDTTEFLMALAKGTRISMIVAPSFFVEYAERAEEILSSLKDMGVENFYHAGFGADIHTYLTSQYLSIAEQEGCVSSVCPSVVNYAQKYAPDMIDRLVPIFSPMECCAIYVRKYLKDEHPLAYLSPCIAHKDEIDDPELLGIVSYSVTFKKLIEQMESMKEELDGIRTAHSRSASGIASPSAFGAAGPALTAQGDAGLAECLYAHSDSAKEQEPVTVLLSDCGLGKLIPGSDGVSENLRHFLGEDTLIRHVAGVDSVYAYMRTYESNLCSNHRTPLFVDAMNCCQGCVTGTGVEHCCDYNDDALYELNRIRGELRKEQEAIEGSPYISAISVEERRKRLMDRFSMLRSEDFVRVYPHDRVIDEEITEDEEREIFHQLYKFTEASQHVDCSSCGYKSCKEMVHAIAAGVNHKENCVRYMKDENLRLYLTDPMTGIPNSNAFNRHLSKILEERRGLGYSAIFFNVRNFKLVNKKYGSKTGDKILIEYSKKVASLATEGELIARWGGDNYIGLFKTVRMQQVLKQLEDIMILINRGDSLEECHLSIRAAIYNLTGKETISGQIMGRITTTYATMNKEGRTHIQYFSEELGKKILHDTRIEEMLEPALSNKEFIVYYQPKVNMQNKQLIGAEALVRWNRGGKLIPPMEFIPLCENNGFVKEIDYYVLEQVCKDIRSWIDEGITPVRISFNFSKLHFDDEYLAEHIHEVAERYNIPPGTLEVEFTEMAYVDDFERLVRTITVLNSFGISTSIDDFGTGYSSLSLLQNVKFNTLKLDKTFVQTPSSDLRNRTVITNIIRMAKELNMEIIAEGVETKEELSFLSNLLCDGAQGYLFDRPLTESDFILRLRQKQYTLAEDVNIAAPDALSAQIEPPEETLPPKADNGGFSLPDALEDVLRRRGENPDETARPPRRALWMEDGFGKK